MLTARHGSLTLYSHRECVTEHTQILCLLLLDVALCTISVLHFDNLHFPNTDFSQDYFPVFTDLVSALSLSDMSAAKVAYLDHLHFVHIFY